MATCSTRSIHLGGAPQPAASRQPTGGLRRDITYGTNSEFGFDYLRDNLVRRPAEKAHRGHHFAIVDEVDNILIDEAAPHSSFRAKIAARSSGTTAWPSWCASWASTKSRSTPREQVVTLTPGGEKHVTTLLGDPLGDPRHPEEASPEQRHLIGHLEQALRARFLYRARPANISSRTIK